MNKLFSLLLFATVVSITSCGGGKNEEEKKEIDPEKNPVGAAMQMASEMEKAAKEQQERIAKGDTSSKAVPYEELYKFLPDDFSGYKKGEPTGATMTAQGLSYSMAEVTYKNDNGDKVKIALIDYSAAFSLYSMATAMWGMGMSVDTPNEKAKGIKMGDKVTGWESFKKKNKEANVILGIGGRFLLSVEASKQEDTEFAKSVAGKIDFNALEALQ